MKAFPRYATLLLVFALYGAWSQGLFQRLRDPATLSGDTCGGRKFCVMVYLAPWCPHCRSSLSQTQELLRKSAVGDTGVRVVVGMGQAGASQTMAARIARNVVLDDDEVLARRFEVRAVPAYVVLDAEGSKVVEGQEGYEWVSEKFKL